MSSIHGLMGGSNTRHYRSFTAPADFWTTVLNACATHADLGKHAPIDASPDRQCLEFSTELTPIAPPGSVPVGLGFYHRQNRSKKGSINHEIRSPNMESDATGA